MAEITESFIAERLRASSGNARSVAQDHLLLVDFDSLSDESSDRLAFFLWNAQLFKELCDWLVLRLKNNNSVPWGLVAELLLDDSSGPALMEILTEGARSQKLFEDLALSHKAQILSDECVQLYASRQKLLLQRHQHERDNLIEKAKLYRYQNLLDAEWQVLSDLKARYPNDPTVRAAFSENEEFKALEVFDKHLGLTSRLPSFEPKQTIDEFKDTLIDLRRAILRAYQEYPEIVDDLAMILVFVDDFEGASILDIESPWLKLEILFGSKDNLRMLTTLDNTECRSAEDVFAISYFKAQVLWRLGQHNEAIQMLSEITTHRPNYRLARYYLSDWKSQRK